MSQQDMDAKSHISKVGSIFGGRQPVSKSISNIKRMNPAQGAIVGEEGQDKKLTHLSDFLREQIVARQVDKRPNKSQSSYRMNNTDAKSRHTNLPGGN